MSHANARLTPRARLELVQQIQAGWSVAEVARATATKWLRRFEQEVRRGFTNRSSAPHHRPRRTPAALAERICAVPPAGARTASPGRSASPTRPSTSYCAAPASTACDCCTA